MIETSQTRAFHLNKVTDFDSLGVNELSCNVKCETWIWIMFVVLRLLSNERIYSEQVYTVFICGWQLTGAASIKLTGTSGFDIF